MFGLERRLIVTLCECAGYFALGLVLAIHGPTLLDLAHQTGSTIEEIGRIFTARSFGYLMGSIFGGHIFDKSSNPCIILTLALAITGTSTFFVPFCTGLAAMYIVISFQGLTMGLVDTGGNVLLLSMWGANCGPYMQALHFAFGLGAFVAPLVAKLFISTDSESIASAACAAPGLNVTAAPEVVTFSSNVKWAYWLCSMVIVPVVAAFAYLAATNPKGGEHSARASQVIVPHRREGWYRRTVLLLAFLFLMLYVGLEVGYGGFIFSYAVKVGEPRHTPHTTRHTPHTTLPAHSHQHPPHADRLLPGLHGTDGSAHGGLSHVRVLGRLRGRPSCCNLPLASHVACCHGNGRPGGLPGLVHPALRHARLGTGSLGWLGSLWRQHGLHLSQRLSSCGAFCGRDGRVCWGLQWEEECFPLGSFAKRTLAHAHIRIQTHTHTQPLSNTLTKHAKSKPKQASI
eukprot:m.72840 g.72840  ORF g.72840 m.72840 type:complete len:457 (+) comp13006_c0_seq2:48-1418(+)